MKRALVVSLMIAAACGPSKRDDGNGDVDAAADGSTGPYATVTGRVWAPNQGPGMVAPGQEIPIAGALVYITTTAPEPIPDHVYCEQCVATPQGGVLTGADGSFSLDVEPGNYTLIIQKGQFRIDQPIALSTGATALPPNMTTLPSKWDPAAGVYMPKVAMAQGTNDQIEDILAKLGFGTMSGNGFGSPVGDNGAKEIEIYSYSGTGPGTVTYLLQNMDEMRKYHIIFFPCAVSMSGINTLLTNQTVLANIRRYVQEGGKLYVTDWSGELADRAFPHQIQLGDSGADSEGTYDPMTLTGTLTATGDADGSFYNLSDGKAVDQLLHDWLGLQQGPTESGGFGMYNADAFEVTDLWNWIKKLNPVQIGTDMMGQPVYDTPKAWVLGTNPNDSGAVQKPIAVTYEPTGCGKVLYTAFQTANGEHQGLYPQERVLLYLIMEIQTCSDNPIF
ncbi:MAG TPA: hypothetical protein VFQ53_24315 [Kofleriaceae bacterium]|nr:hypothetical protein [Kofleriaceae bacterium]